MHPPSANRPTRKSLYHDPPSWIVDGAVFFITICCARRGGNQLALPEVGQAIQQSIQARRQAGQWWPHLVLLMPDHLHALISFSPHVSMNRVISDWKRYLARHARIAWQRDYFDHRIRQGESLEEKWSYITENPVRAGLVAAAEDWPFVYVAPQEW